MKENIIHIIGIIIVIGVLAFLGFSVQLEFGVKEIEAGLIIILCLVIAILLSYLIYWLFDRKYFK